MPNRAVNEFHYFILITIIAAFGSISGCAAIDIPKPSEIISHPLGTESIKIGMTKDEVESKWGKPDNIVTVEDKARWGGSREVWTYNANYGSIPVNAGYLSNTKKLFFDGNNLTEIG